MKHSYFYKIIVEPDAEKRNALLRKLHYLKNSVKFHKDPSSIKELKHKLRDLLKSVNGHTLYYRSHKGIKIYIGNETTRKKYFLLSKEPAHIKSIIGPARSARNYLHRSQRSRNLPSSDTYLNYQTVGGVFSEPGFFTHQIRKIRKNKVFINKRPATKDKYIGIELEFASTMNKEDIAEIIVALGLYDNVRVMSDSSIRTEGRYKYQIELCILAKQSELKRILDLLKSMMINELFIVNDTCGFHVHIDARGGDQSEIFYNLTSMQSVLFALAHESRRENRYCVPVLESDFTLADEDAHYAAISKYSFYKHNTIEVRIHESTLDLTIIEKWVNLLTKIAYYRGPKLIRGTFDSEIDQLKNKLVIEPELLNYVEVHR